MSTREERQLCHQYVLNNAMAVEKLAGKKIANHPLRQEYHIMPTVNWMNDPCAMVWFKGYYHVFYQYDPYHITPRGMFFGHVRSKDLVHWEQLPIALAPSDPWELYGQDVQGKNFGIFTGSAVVDGDRMIIAYCASSYDYDDKLVQKICLAFSSDGIHFEKYEKNPIINEPPEDGSRDFRDPKLWKHDGIWYLMMGSCKAGNGKVLLYRSENLEKWDYIGVTAQSSGNFGTMWECPDFFKLDGYDVLIFSPIGMYHVDTCWQIGHMDYTSGKFTCLNWGKVDLGKEFYAPQTLLSPDGRRILIGWCNMWAHDGRDTFTSFGKTTEHGWCGHMSLPRVLHINEQMELIATPISEISLLRQEPSRICRYLLKDAVQPLNFDGWKASELYLHVKNLSAPNGRCGVRIRCSESQYTEIGWDFEKKAVYLDRSHSDGVYNDIQYYECSIDATDKLHIFSDTVSLEIFDTHGFIRASNNIYPDEHSTGIELFSSETKCELTLEMWQLRK